jgi:hypothetical protein
MMKDDERRIDDEEQGEDENMKLLTRRKEEKERREIKNQKEINNSLFELEENILCMRTRPNNRYSLLSRRPKQMMKLDWLEGSYHHFIIKAQSLLMIRQSDSSNESTDTKTQKTVNGKRIRWLERQIGSAQTLERCIESLQHYRQTMEGLESLKHVLRSEMSLEQEWLNRLDDTNSLELSGSTSFTPSHQNDHIRRISSQ